MNNENWINIKEAVESAKTMVSTVVITLLFKNSEVITFVVDVTGIEQMVAVIKKLDNLKLKKKIQTYYTNNITAYPAIDVPTFNKMVAEVNV